MHVNSKEGRSFAVDIYIASSGTHGRRLRSLGCRAKVSGSSETQIFLQRYWVRFFSMVNPSHKSQCGGTFLLPSDVCDKALPLMSSTATVVTSRLPTVKPRNQGCSLLIIHLFCWVYRSSKVVSGPRTHASWTVLMRSAAPIPGIKGGHIRNPSGTPFLELSL